MVATGSRRQGDSRIGKDKLHIINRQTLLRKTPLIALQKAEEYWEGEGCPGSNSNPNVVLVDPADCHEWTAFREEMSENIRQLFSKDNVNTFLNRPLDEKELASFTWAIEAAGLVSEQAVERLWDHVNGLLNVMQKLLAAEIDETLDGRYIRIGDGTCARKQCEQHPEKSSQTKADLAGYEYIPRSKKLETKQMGKERDNIDNRIPGDIKVSWKLTREMLPPYSEEMKASKSYANYLEQAIRVLSQIHFYMDKHETRYGYITTNEICIFFRRRGTGWGHLDISPAVSHGVEGDFETGTFNSKMVLFYLHRVVANDEAQWKLKSCWSTIKKRATGRTATTSKSITKRTIRVEATAQAASLSLSLDMKLAIPLTVKGSKSKGKK